MHNLGFAAGNGTRHDGNPHTDLFLDQGPVGALVCTTNGRVLYVNHRLMDWLGYEPQDLAPDLTFADLLYGSDRQIWAERVLATLQAQREVHSLELRLLCSDGTSLSSLLSARRFAEAETDDTVDYFVITKQSPAMARFFDPAASEVDQTSSLFLSTFSHEILTPLNAIIGTANLLQETDLDDQQAHLQSILIRSGHHLLSLFKNILVISKSGLDELQPARHALRPDELLTAIIDSFRYGTEREDYNFAAEIDPHVPDVLIGDSALLSQVMTNLVGNAARHTESGSVRAGITLLEDLPGDRCRVRFFVKDTGIGMDVEELKKLFQPHHHSIEELQGQYVGRGLGLAICNRILRGYDSKLEVSSRRGKGSTFWFDLELGVGRESDVTLQEFGNLPPLAKGRVLIVDDNRTNSYLVARHFRKWEVGYDLAGNGQEGLDRVMSEDYDIVLMDLKMPVMDGYTAARKIRQLPGKKSKIPIIAFSASASLSITDRMRDAQIDEFALKPFSPRQLYNLVEKFLNPKVMNYPDLREAMDNDPEDLRNFAAVLQRELSTAADELGVALQRNDVQQVSDLQHKLKTSLQLLDATDIRDELAQLTEDLRSGTPITAARKHAAIEQIRQCVIDLGRERW